jgi:hypothetical protein
MGGKVKRILAMYFSNINEQYYSYGYRGNHEVSEVNPKFLILRKGFALIILYPALCLSVLVAPVFSLTY